MELSRFADSEVVLSPEDGYATIRFFFGQCTLPPQQLTLGDRKFAQALLVEGVNATYEMKYVEIIFDNFFLRVPPDFQNLPKLLEKVVKASAKNWWTHATEEDLRNPKIYETVRRQIQQGFASTWENRVQTGELIY